MKSIQGAQYWSSADYAAEPKSPGAFERHATKYLKFYLGVASVLLVYGYIGLFEEGLKTYVFVTQYLPFISR